MELPPSGPTKLGFVCPVLPPYILEGKPCPVKGFTHPYKVKPPEPQFKPQYAPAPHMQQITPQFPPAFQDPPEVFPQKTNLGFVCPVDPPYLSYGIRCPVPGYKGKEPKKVAPNPPPPKETETRTTCPEMFPPLEMGPDGEPHQMTPQMMPQIPPQQMYPQMYQQQMMPQMYPPEALDGLYPQQMMSQPGMYPQQIEQPGMFPYQMQQGGMFPQIFIPGT